MPHIPAPKMIWATAKMARYQRVSRTPMESLFISLPRRKCFPVSTLSVLTNHVSHPAHGVNQLGPAGGINLAAQQVHERVESILLDFAVKSPDCFNQRPPRHDFAGAV